MTSRKPKPKARAKKAKAPAKAVEPQQLETINVRVNVGHRYQPGNRFWELRSSHGRKPIFPTPEALWNAATEYFDWVEENPLFEMRAFAYQGQVVQEPVAKMRIMTIQGLCLFLDISDECWSNYKKRPDFVGICEEIEKVIRLQGITGASADLLNPMIVARVHGLKESIEAKHTGSGPSGEIETINRIELVALPPK